MASATMSQKYITEGWVSRDSQTEDTANATTDLLAKDFEQSLH